VPEQVLKPFIAGRRVHLGLLIFSYIAGSAAFGPIGLFIGPVILILGTSFFKNFILKQG
jgi:predicted PurR-regulated permease PerM